MGTSGPIRSPGESTPKTNIRRKLTRTKPYKPQARTRPALMSDLLIEAQSVGIGTGIWPSGNAHDWRTMPARKTKTKYRISTASVRYSVSTSSENVNSTPTKYPTGARVQCRVTPCP